MFYRPDYNMLMCFTNAHASTAEQSFYLPFSGPSAVAGPVERFIYQQHQAQTFQDLINHQQTIIKNNLRHNLVNNIRHVSESQKISTKESERFKKLLENAGSKSAEESKRKSFDIEKIQTRSNSPGSDISSGFGTMPSPISDLDSPPVLLPPAKDTGDSTKSRDTIIYQGRDLLDLYTNMTYQWSFQMAVLPQHTLKTHFQYRSLYHRLGPVGMIDELATNQCVDCGFEMVIPKN